MVTRVQAITMTDGQVLDLGVTQLCVNEDGRNGAMDARCRGKTANIGLNGLKSFGLGKPLTLASARKGDEVCPLEIHEHGLSPLTAPVDKDIHKLINIVQLQRSDRASAENRFRHA